MTTWDWSHQRSSDLDRAASRAVRRPAGSPGLPPGTAESRQEGGVLGRGQTFVEHLERAGQIAPQQRGGVEPQSGKDQAAHDAAVIGFQPLVAAAAEHVPVDLLIENAPDETETPAPFSLPSPQSCSCSASSPSLLAVLNNAVAVRCTAPTPAPAVASPSSCSTTSSTASSAAAPETPSISGPPRPSSPPTMRPSTSANGSTWPYPTRPRSSTPTETRNPYSKLPRSAVQLSHNPTRPHPSPTNPDQAAFEITLNQHSTCLAFRRACPESVTWLRFILARNSSP